jgi:hypothetical protein
MAAKVNDVHIVTDPKGTGWASASNGVVLTRHRSKNAAIKKGRATAQRHGAVFTIHRKDGTVVEQRTYAVEPLQ